MKPMQQRGPSVPIKLRIKKNTGILPEYKPRILQLAAVHSLRDVAAKIMEEGHPEVSYATIRRWLMSVKEPPKGERPDADVLAHIEMASEYAPANRTPGYDLAMASLDQINEQIAVLVYEIAELKAEASRLSADSDTDYMETGPLEKLPDGSTGRRYLLNADKQRIPMTEAKMGAVSRAKSVRLAAIKTALACLQAKLSCYQVLAQNKIMAARLEIMVKPKPLEAREVTKAEHERVLQVATPEELQAILDGPNSEKTFTAVLMRVRAQG